MKFSFVVPAYNEGKFLGKCLKSIKAQDYNDYETIVSYSPSKDDTLEIAKKYGAKIVALPKCFPGAAKNAGARHATGEYLVFMDADTLIPKDFLRSTLKHLGRGRVAVAYPSRWTDGDRVLDMFNDVVKNPLSKQSKLLFFCYVVEKSAFDRIGGFARRMKANEDWDLSKRLKKIGKIAYNESAVVGVSARRFRKLGKLKSLAVYSSWFILGYVLGKEARYFHISDTGKKRWF